MITHKSISSTQAMRLDSVCAYVGLSRSSIYNKISETSPYFDPSFPKPYKLGAAAIAWDRTQLEAWTRMRMTEYSK